MSETTAPGSSPRASRPPGRATNVGDEVAVDRGDPARAGLVPEARHHLGERAAQRLRRRRAARSRRRASRRSASSIPGTARIGRMETNGFDGARKTTSAPAIASTTPGAGRDVLGALVADAGHRGRRAGGARTTSWKSSSPSGVVWNVRRRVVGRRQEPDAHPEALREPLRRPPRAARPSAAVACGARWRPTSRSPSVNQVSPPSLLGRGSIASYVSSRTPQPRSSSRRPASV